MMKFNQIYCFSFHYSIVILGLVCKLTFYVIGKSCGCLDIVVILCIMGYIFKLFFC